MSQPVASHPSPEPEPAAQVPAEPATGESVDEETEAPLNRAARRAKARQAGPSHVGPRDDLERRVKGAGAARKRRR